MAQPISPLHSRGVADTTPKQGTAPKPHDRGFVRGGGGKVGGAVVAAPHGSSVHASQDAEAQKIVGLFGTLNPGPAHSFHTAQFKLGDGVATIEGTRDRLVITGEGFEIEINHGELGRVTGLPGDLMRYRKLLEIDDALQKHVGLPGVWPASTKPVTPSRPGAIPTPG